MGKASQRKKKARNERVDFSEAITVKKLDTKAGELTLKKVPNHNECAEFIVGREEMEDLFGKDAVSCFGKEQYMGIGSIFYQWMQSRRPSLLLPMETLANALADELFDQMFPD